MPFRLKNTSCKKFCVVYIVYVLVFSNNKKEHMSHLEQVTDIVFSNNEEEHMSHQEQVTDIF